MTHFNRYAKNEVSDLHYNITADISKYSVESIGKNKNQIKIGEVISPILHGDKNAPKTWLLM